MTFVPLHHVRKGTRLSPSLLFIVVMRGQSLGTRLIESPDTLLDSDLEDIIDMWNKQSRRIYCCLGQNLYILLGFSLRLITLGCIFLVLSFSSVFTTSNYPLKKKMTNLISNETLAVILETNA